MNTRNKNSKSEQIWISLFLVIPVVCLSMLSDNFTKDNFTQILYSGALGGIGGLLGYAFHYFVKSSKPLIKVFALLALTALLYTTIYLVTKIKYQTCEICGYIAVDSKTQECKVCGNAAWEKEQSHGNAADRNHWLADEQLFWFAIDSMNQPIDFYKPDIQDNFHKDKSWRPNITAKDLAEDYLERNNK